jgi:hypothetical protein
LPHTLSARKDQIGGSGVMDALETLKRVHAMAVAMQAEIDAILSQVPPVTNYITYVERGETSNSKSPMWRCTCADGERVNIFKHEDPQKNSYALFEAAGYGELLMSLAVNDFQTWEYTPIEVQMKKIGKWWEIIFVSHRPNGALPDTNDQSPSLDSEAGHTSLNNLRDAMADWNSE